MTICAPLGHYHLATEDSREFSRSTGLNYHCALLISVHVFKISFFVDFSFFRVNCYDVLHAQAPFGGYKMSGSGREL